MKNLGYTYSIKKNTLFAISLRADFTTLTVYARIINCEENIMNIRRA